MNWYLRFGIVWLGLGFVVALGAGYLIRTSWRAPILAVALGFVLAVMSRVEVETSREPTSHNLWPFEVFIAGGIGLVASVLGVAASRLLQRITAAR